jgi:hypothetical protein
MSRIKCGGLKNDPIGTTPGDHAENADVSRLSVPMAVNSRSSEDQKSATVSGGRRSLRMSGGLSRRPDDTRR